MSNVQGRAIFKVSGFHHILNAQYFHVESAANFSGKLRNNQSCHIVGASHVVHVRNCVWEN